MRPIDFIFNIKFKKIENFHKFKRTKKAGTSDFAQLQAQREDPARWATFSMTD